MISLQRVMLFRCLSSACCDAWDLDGRFCLNPLDEYTWACWENADLCHTHPSKNIPFVLTILGSLNRFSTPLHSIMANPRQRSKARSHKSTKPSQAIKRRLHHKLRKAPPLKGPEVLQRGWDRNKTVFQKYVGVPSLISTYCLRLPAQSPRCSKAPGELMHSR